VDRLHWDEAWCVRIIIVIFVVITIIIINLTTIIDTTTTQTTSITPPTNPPPSPPSSLNPLCCPIRFAYARFNPLYRDRFAMRGDPSDHNRDGPTVFATQSTHKLLAGTEGEVE
jgi:arginine/lysine/ornithine decarboxylase